MLLQEYQHDAGSVAGRANMCGAIYVQVMQILPLSPFFNSLLICDFDFVFEDRNGTYPNKKN